MRLQVRHAKKGGAAMAWALALSVASLLAGCGGDDDDARDSGGVTGVDAELLTVSGGTTTLDIDEAVRADLARSGIEISALGEAVRTPSGIEMPITRGTVRASTLVGVLEHGQAGFRAAGDGGEAVEFAPIVLPTGEGLLVAEGSPTRVIARLELSDLDSTLNDGRLVVPDIPVEMEETLAEALLALGAEDVEPGMRLGTVTISADVEPRT